jgi:hypothetical protein
MKLFLLLGLGAALALSCSGDWRDLQELQEELRCGMTLNEVAGIAATYGFTANEAEAEESRLSQTLRREGHFDQLVLFFVRGELESVQGYRHTEVKQLCEYPELNLCTGERRVRVTIEHSIELEGSSVSVDSEDRGTLSGGAVDMYLLPGERHVEVVRPDGGRHSQRFQLRLPEDCNEINPRVKFK